MAVSWEDVTARDYRKGPRHMDEYWRRLEGESDLPRRQLVYVFVDYAVCSNGIGRVLQAARAVLRVVRSWDVPCRPESALTRWTPRSLMRGFTGDLLSCIILTYFLTTRSSLIRQWGTRG
jgi:hypothetical protein